MNISITLDSLEDAKELLSILENSEEIYNKTASFQMDEIVETLQDFIEESGE